MADPAVLRHVIASITPASVAHGEAARRRVARAGAPVLAALAARLGAAQHTPRPRVGRRTVVVAAGDHGAGDPGIALGDAHPTIVAAHAIASGDAALARVARAGRAAVIIVDAGVREPAWLPAGALGLGLAPSGDLRAGPAMTVLDAALALEAGIALAVSLQEAGLDVIAIGALGLGAELASTALLAAATRTPPGALGDAEAEAAGALAAGFRGGGLDLLASFGGPETGVLAGLILAAASTNVPVILDGHATGAAALVAAAFAPAVTGYLIAAHVGSFTHPRILAHLGLHPIFDVGLGHGEGTGAAMVLPLLDQVAALADGG
ncbi:MAG TPA: nicotinate-nucleotide--dimethylbenzimidazole phosphoribosyltransferase [Kofleriaceae bacterium]